MRGLSTVALTAVALAAAASTGAPGCAPSTADCGGFCGEGTACEAGRCVAIATPAPAAEPEPEEPADGNRRRRKGKRSKGSAAGKGLPDDDRHIARYRSDRVEAIGEGSERLSDRKVRQELATVEPAFNRCLARASEVTDATLAGTVSFQVGIDPSGKVWGVNASLPSSWDVPGLRACFRKAVYEHRFPSWDGPAMGVDYHFEVD